MSLTTVWETLSPTSSCMSICIVKKQQSTLCGHSWPHDHRGVRSKQSTHPNSGLVFMLKCQRELRFKVLFRIFTIILLWSCWLQKSTLRNFFRASISNEISSCRPILEDSMIFAFRKFVKHHSVVVRLK